MQGIKYLYYNMVLVGTFLLFLFYFMMVIDKIQNGMDIFDCVYILFFASSISIMGCELLIFITAIPTLIIKY